MSDLKHCPFCGHEPELTADEVSGSVGCAACSAKGPEIFRMKDNAAAAADAWNGRAPDPLVEAVVKAAREYRDAYNMNCDCCDRDNPYAQCSCTENVAREDERKAALWQALSALDARDGKETP